MEIKDIIAITMFSSGAILFLLFGILSVISGETKTTQNHVELSRAIHVDVICIGFMILGIGLKIIN